MPNFYWIKIIFGFPLLFVTGERLTPLSLSEHLLEESNYQDLIIKVFYIVFNLETVAELPLSSSLSVLVDHWKRHN